MALPDLVIQIPTLLFVGAYTLITWRIFLAAKEQAEASQKPVVVLQFVTRRDDADQVFEKIEMGIVPQAMRLASTAEDKPIIKNIGSGPALNVECVLRLASEPSLKDPHSHPRKLPYLAPSDSIGGPTTFVKLGSNAYKFVATYQSLSGATYQTVMTIAGGVLQENWSFRRMRKFKFARVRRAVLS
jgi:hypothetical protein